MIYLAIAGVILVFLTILKVYMFEDSYMALVAGEPITYPLFTLKSGQSYFCWLTGINLRGKWVDPIYRGLLTFYITPRGIALEIGIGLAGLLVGFKKEPPYFVFDIGNRLDNHMIE